MIEASKSVDLEVNDDKNIQNVHFLKENLTMIKGKITICRIMIQYRRILNYKDIYKKVKIIKNKFKLDSKCIVKIGNDQFVKKRFKKRI